MKVLFVSGEFPPMQGGVGDYTRELGLALVRQGCAVQVVSSAAAGPVAGLDVHPLLESWGWGSWPRLLALVRAQQPDLVHVQYQAAAYGMHPAVNLFPRRLRLLGRGRRPLLAVTYHDLKVPYLFPKAGPLRRWVVEELARGCDAAITTNREDHDALTTTLRRSGPAVSLIPIGSNLAPHLPEGYQREAWRARWGAAADDLLLCFFGFVNDRKGVDTLLQALRLLVEQGGTLSPRLLMIGGQTGASDPTNVAYLARIQAEIAATGLEERVRWTGYLPGEEVSACFACADLCVLPFRDGVSFLHGTFHAALAHGAAIVTTRPGVPLPELVEGENVRTVPPEEPKALAQAIVQLAAEPGLRHRLGEGARRLALQFTWEAIAASTLELYRSLLSSARRRS